MKLQINESPIDRIARIALALVLFVLAATATVAAPWIYLAWGLGALMLVTGVVGFCPLYAVLRISSLAIRR